MRRTRPGSRLGKPMLATETGRGALDDGNRSEVLAVELELPWYKIAAFSGPAAGNVSRRVNDGGFCTLNAVRQRLLIEMVEAIEKLVDPKKGIGMNLMRICIGTPDFTGEPWYSYDDMPEGQTDPKLEHFSIEKDRAYVLPVLKKALEINRTYFCPHWDRKI